MSTKTRISIVIPVYNEAERIHDCLQAIADQTVAPLEVLVIDNNSTDGTPVLAAQFPFVRVLHERRQGVVHARDRGFNAARGDIIARIDADTLLTQNWLETLGVTFADPAVDVVSGSISYREVAGARVANAIDIRWRQRLARLLYPYVGMMGANMALRRSAWRQIRGSVCREATLHEDLDLGIHAALLGLGVEYEPSLHASVCCRQVASTWGQFAQYVWISPQTYARHGIRRGRRMYEVVFTAIAAYPLLRGLVWWYEGEVSAPRVNPATFVD